VLTTEERKYLEIKVIMSVLVLLVKLSSNYPCNAKIVDVLNVEFVSNTSFREKGSITS